MTLTSTQVPDACLRTLVAYRTPSGPGLGMALAGGAGLIGIGVIDKSAQGQDAKDATPEHYSALYVLRGRARYSDSTGIQATAGPGSLIQRMPDRTHTLELESGSGFCECFIATTHSFARALIGMGVIDRLRPVVDPGLDLSVVDELIAARDRLRTIPQPELPLLTARILGILQDLLVRDHLGTSGDRDQQLVALACQRLGESLAERRTLMHLMRDSRMSYERFRKIFRARMGMSPGDYRIHRRIERARELLDARELPIHAIAEHLGYANPFVFSAQFKRIVGIAPQMYLRRR